ncbi:MAG TPA: lysophospholipid acyltransferase family protein, partial [Longimicrobiales bacterium]|nr:lysophospholipid acyltransferase family protein [Longimicrobiales bacterium]
AASLPVDYRFVAKKELARIPIFGAAWQACGHIAIDRQDRGAAVESLGEARRQVGDASPTIVMFPEGTRSPDGALHAFKKGAFVLAIQAGVPVVPTAIIGSRAIMEKGSLKVRSGTIRVRIGEAIPVDGLTHRDRNELTSEAREAVARLRGGTGTLDHGGKDPDPGSSRT